MKINHVFQLLINILFYDYRKQRQNKLLIFSYLRIKSHFFGHRVTAALTKSIPYEHFSKNHIHSWRTIKLGNI
jgi:hypothetical protein